MSDMTEQTFGCVGQVVPKNGTQAAPDAACPCRTNGDPGEWRFVRTRTPGAERLNGLRMALRHPDPGERGRLVAERVVAGETYAEIGAQMGVTRQRVEQIVSRLLQKDGWRPMKRGRPRKT